MKSLFLLLLFTARLAQAQNIDSLISAEKSFAAYALAHNTKEAFIRYSDKEGLVFEKGLPINAKESWGKKEVRSGILAWAPMWAELSLSGNFGYTTGPWTFHPKAVTDSVVARGYFTTVWHLDENGQWRFLADMGVGNTPAPVTGPVQKIAPAANRLKPDGATVDEAEKEFIQLYNKDKITAYKKLLSDRCILHRNGQLAATSGADQQQAVAMTPADLQFQVLQTKASPANDMGYSYGSVTVNGKTESYLHIWRKEKDGWKIAVEVLRY